MGKEEIRHILESLARITQNNSQGPTKSLTASTSTSNNNAEHNQIWAKDTGNGVVEFSYSYSYDSTPKGLRANEVKMISLLKSLKIELNKGDGEGVDILLKNSCLISVVSAYLRNNSILDIARHVPLYYAIVQLIRSIATIPKLWFLLMSGEGDSTISKLLVQLNDTLQNYSRLLEASNTKDLNLAKLISDIQAASTQVVEEAVNGFVEVNTKDHDSKEGKTEEIVRSMIAPVKTIEVRYVEEMKKLQFAFMEMIGPEQVFKVPYHFEGETRKNWAAETTLRIASRNKRLAMESMILSTSLPLSYGSSVFVRSDTDRLDVIKVLIIGPAGTPYSNGCFEFDVHFPCDYPSTPPMVHMTTGVNKVVVHPNLIVAGYVSLSILNTCFGEKKKERWNPKKFSLLPVLVAIQSMVFVDEPYWNRNEPLITCRTDLEMTESRHYNSYIRQNTLQYAILGQIRNQTSCFKEVIQRHFWMKRKEILAQCEEWKKEGSYGIYHPFEQDLSALKREFMQMNPPEGLEDLRCLLEKPEEFKLDMNMNPSKGLKDPQILSDFKSELNQQKEKCASHILKRRSPDNRRAQKMTGTSTNLPLSHTPVAPKSAAITKGKKKCFKKETNGQCCYCCLQ